MKLRRLAMYVGVIATIGILAFVLVIPSGVSNKAPQAQIEVVITDLNTSDMIHAAAVVGNPTNTVSVYKPVIKFEPLSTFEQTVQVYSGHYYSIAVKAIYKYSGSNIKSFNNATVYIFAQKGIAGIEYGMYNNEIIQKVSLAGPGDPTKTPYRFNFFYVGQEQIPSSAATETIGMNPDDPYTKYAPVSYDAVVGSASQLKAITGVDLDSWVFHCRIFVGATDMDGNIVVGQVTADLVLHASVTPSGGSISLSIDGMSANINEV